MEDVKRKAESGKKLKPYDQPAAVQLGNVWEITRECANWQCSVTVPPAP